MSPPCHRRKRTAALACLLFLILPAFAGYEVLATFRKPGSQATGRLLRLAGGEIYGTTTSGGALGLGTVFRVTPAGAVETLHSFSGSDGRAPAAGLVQGADGAFYGTTSAGGAQGFGTIFKITAAGSLTKLVDFTGTTGTAKGSVPGALRLHPDGNFYGVTGAGGIGSDPLNPGGFGTLFRLTPAGALTTLVEFTGANGAEPTGTLALHGSTLYGATRIGGAGNVGTLFRLTSAGSFTSLHHFSGADGARPAGGLLLHSDGLLYGSTEFGGAESFGTAFRLDTGASPVVTTLHSFADLAGSQPVGELVAADANHLLGTVAAGGASGWGGVYQLTPGGAFTMLASFTGEAGAVPGAAPRAGLTLGSDGLFHGVTSAGGPGNLGTVFKISAAGAYTVTTHLSPPGGWMPSGAPLADGAGGYLFPLAAGGAGGGTLARWSESGGLTLVASLGGSVGSTPDGGLLAKAGAFYGLASQGAGAGRGAAFRYQPGVGVTLVNSFTSTGGALPEGALIDGSDGALYGVGREGGTSARGTIYKVTTAGVRTRIVSFTGTAGTAPGTVPRGPLVLAANQSYYGVTARGGSSDSGVLFKISSLGTYSVLAHFTATGPRLPAGGLVAGTDGFLYGTCSSGGAAGAGALIRVNPADDSWTVAASFDGTTAASPAGELHAAADGSILGLATAPGSGAVFRYHPATGITVPATFTGANGAATADDGAGLVFTGGLTRTPDGVIVGTAAGGGPDGGGVLFRIVPDTPLTLWKSAQLGSSTAPDDADPDRDGLANLLEYALGTLPLLPDAAAQPVAAIVGNFLQLTVPRDPARSDVVLLVEASSDLATWLPLAASVNGSAFDGPGYLSGESPGASVKSIVVRDLQPVTAAPRRFLRLRVLSGFNPATPLESWKMARLGDPAAPDDGDPDRDGQPNLLEYALGRLPTVPDAAPLPASLAGGFLTLTVPRDPARSDLILTVEATGNLAEPWTTLATSILGSAFTGPGYLSGESPGAGVKTVLVRDLIAVTAAPRRFIRLRVTR